MGFAKSQTQLSDFHVTSHITKPLSGQGLKRFCSGNSPGGPVVRTSLSSAAVAGSIHSQGAKTPTCLRAKKPKPYNKSNIVTNPIKTVKMVHIKKKQKDSAWTPGLGRVLGNKSLHRTS